MATQFRRLCPPLFPFLTFRKVKYRLVKDYKDTPLKVSYNFV